MEHEDRTLEINRHVILRIAEEVATTDVDQIPVTRVTQAALGWMKAALHQAQIIATLASTDLSYGCGPNRRLFVELALRLQWLDSLEPTKRSAAIDAMIDHQIDLDKKGADHIRGMGLADYQPDTEGRDDLVLNPAQGSLKAQARSFLPAAQSEDGQGFGLYTAWHSETQYSHATVLLAAAYTPSSGGSSRPPITDVSLDTHLLAVAHVVVAAHDLLVTEGVSAAKAQALITALEKALSE